MSAATLFAPTSTTLPSSAGSWAPVGVGGPPDPASNPYSAYAYLDGGRQLLLASAHQRPLVRLWDQDHKFIGQLTQEISVEAEEIYCDTGAATVKIRKDNWLSDFILFDRLSIQDLHLTVDPMPTLRSWRTRWGGKITTVNAKRDSSGLHTIELNAVHNREHYKHILAGANPVLPPEVQLPKMWILPFNCRTALFVSLFINLARQFETPLAMIDNIANPIEWIGILRDGSIDPLAWPIQAQIINSAIDTSRFEVFAARWNDFHTTTAAIMEDAGVIARAYTYIYGEDTTSPHPEVGLMPTRTCVVIAFEDKSGVTGPGGTFASGPLSAITGIADDLLTDNIIPQYAPDGAAYYVANAGEGPLVTMDPLQIANWFQIAPAPPTVVFQDGEYSQIVESNHAVHGATAKTIMTGSKSPGWLNDLITFGIKYGLSQLSDVIEFAYAASGAGVVAAEGAYQQPATPGLDELYQGELSDVFLAYERNSIPGRELWGGSMGFLEKWQQGTGTAYTVSGILSLRAGQWATRDYISYKTTVRNAAPYIYNYDFTLGDRVGFQMDQIIFCDQVASVKYNWDLNTPVNYSISVGTDRNEIDPVSAAITAIAGIWNAIGLAAGSSELF
jgi:hypothetical protein